MIDNVTPLVRSQLLSHQATPLLLIEVQHPQAVPTPIILVLDFSDSCISIGDSIHRVRSILSTLPRESPLHIFRLSDARPLNENSADTIDDFIDGRVDLTRLLNDHQFRSSAQHLGSFIRPIFRACAKNDAVNNGRSLMIVLTDGRLHDRSAIKVPEKMIVLGIGAESAISNQTQWRKIFSNHAFVSWQSLDFAKYSQLLGSQPGEMNIQVVELESSTDSELFRLYLSDKHLEPMGPEGQFWNGRSGPFYVVRRSLRPYQGGVELLFRFQNSTIRSAVPEPQTFLGEVQLSSVQQAVGSALQGSGDVLLHLVSTDVEFEVATGLFRNIEQLADAHAAWTDGTQFLSLLKQMIDSANKQAAQFDALLCMRTESLDGANAQIAFVALRQDQKTSLHWRGGQLSPLGIFDTEMRLRYDRMEARWLVSCGNAPEVELEPRNSERISLPIAIDRIPWVGFFSGPLNRMFVSRDSP